MTEAWALGATGVPPALWACLSVHSCSQTHSPCVDRAQLQQLGAALLLSPAHISHREALGKIPLQCGHLFSLDPLPWPEAVVEKMAAPMSRAEGG